jgi:thioredoxin-dependent peroxiredoxin
MRLSFSVPVCGTLALLLSASSGASAWAALKPGEAAPDFTVDAARGGQTFHFSLADALKRGPVVLYFYPKSFTSTCTMEAHAFAENIDNFAAAGASVIGVSSDKIDVQQRFSTMECRDKFPVGADPKAVVIKAYDAVFSRSPDSGIFANRISYVIGPDGKILYSYVDPDADAHIKNALDIVRKWHATQKP